ncbi:hypothetical protein STEG23_007518 [Scotinomys teguina]
MEERICQVSNSTVQEVSSVLELTTGEMNLNRANGHIIYLSTIGEMYGHEGLVSPFPLEKDVSVCCPMHWKCDPPTPMERVLRAGRGLPLPFPWKLWKQQSLKTSQKPNRFIKEEWIRKMWYIYTMEYYAAEKNNDIMKFAGKWMELENVILSEGIDAFKNNPSTKSQQEGSVGKTLAAKTDILSSVSGTHRMESEN